MPLLPMLMYKNCVVPRGAPRTLERLLGLNDHPSPTPFSIRRQICPCLHRKDSSLLITSDRNTFQVSLEVQQFTPEELFIKSLNDNMIQVEGKHGERQDEHGLISRHFIRKYTLPNGHDTKNVTSTLSSDGVLTIISRKRKHECNEREIPIKLTGPCQSAAPKNCTGNPEKKEEKENCEPNEKKTKM